MEFRLTNLKKEYRYPDSYKREDGSSKYAFVTFLMRNDNYLPGALMYAYGLRRKGTGADLVCMVSGNVSYKARQALYEIYDIVVDMNEIYVSHTRGHDRQDIPYVFTRFNALRLGADGDLGFSYEKIVVGDADLLPVRFYDHLLTLDTPAGIINEKKDNFMTFDKELEYIIPKSVWETGKWRWHDVYESICPHGASIPADITDKVITDFDNLGINSSLFVLTPSMEEFENIKIDIEKPGIKELVEGKFNWPEMQYATMRWSGKWNSIDVRFSGLNGYPDPSVLCGIHYAGIKPWNANDEKSMKRVIEFPDYYLWYTVYLEMMANHPALMNFKKLKKLNELIAKCKKGGRNGKTANKKS